MNKKILPVVYFTSQKKFFNRTLNLPIDVDSLFTYIPLDETIHVCIEYLYKDNEDLYKIPRVDFCNLINKETLGIIGNIMIG